MSTIQPTSLLLFSLVVRSPTGAMFVDAEMIMKNVVYTSWLNVQCILYLLMCYTGVFRHQQFCFIFTFYGSGCYPATVTLAIFRPHLSMLNFSVLIGHSGCCRRLFPKTHDETQKVFLVWLEKIHCEHVTAVTLTRHKAFWSNIGPSNLDRIWYLAMINVVISFA